MLHGEGEESIPLFGDFGLANQIGNPGGWLQLSSNFQPALVSPVS